MLRYFGMDRTIQRISEKSTIIGICVFGAIVIGIRLILLLLILASILAIGPQAGGIVMVTLLIHIQISLLLGRADFQRAHLIIVIGAIFMVGLDWFGYWPEGPIAWRWDELRMYYSWRGAEFVPATSAIVLTRLFAMFFLPVVVFEPVKLMDWALRTEIAWPLARETRFAPGDPGSIAAPDGVKIKQAVRGSKDEVEPGVEHVVIPGIEMEGE